MHVYRLAHPQYANDLSGYGSMLVPGRWNFKGHRLLYTAENSSLALLEYLAHAEGLKRRLPYQLITIEVPDKGVDKLPSNSIPKDWKNESFNTREIGSKWLALGESLSLKVPSVINEDNSNYLINPQHIDFNKVKIINIKEISFDQRLW